jgi:Zn-finger nucleic acid-binding protein
MNCPRCKSVLTTRTYEAEVKVDECPDCHGVWLDASDLKQIEDTVENDYSEQLKTPDNTVGRSFEMARQQSLPDIDCPKCGRRMVKKERHHASGVLVDQCPGCAGFWLDRGELESLEVFTERLRQEERRDAQRGFFAGLRRLLGG